MPEVTYGLRPHVGGDRRASTSRRRWRGLRLRPRGVAKAARGRARDRFWISDPNNPTGGTRSARAWSELLDGLPPDCVVVADEAYMDFAGPDVGATARGTS